MALPPLCIELRRCLLTQMNRVIDMPTQMMQTQARSRHRQEAKSSGGAKGDPHTSGVYWLVPRAFKACTLCWILSSRVDPLGGIAWPAAPEESERVSAHYTSSSPTAHIILSLMAAHAPDISHGACAGTAPVPKSKLKSGFRSEPLPAATITTPNLLEFRLACPLARVCCTTPLQLVTSFSTDRW